MQVLLLLNSLNFILPLIWLAVLLVYFLIKEILEVKWINYGILISLALFLALAFYNTLATYNTWKTDPISRYLLPPYSASYFFEYSFFHYWLPGFVGLFVSLVWAGILFGLMKYSAGRFLDETDVCLGFFTALAVGWPKFIVYLVLAFGLLLAHQVANNLVFKKNSPAALTLALVMGALVTVVFGDLFVNRLGLAVLAF